MRRDGARVWSLLIICQLSWFFLCSHGRKWQTLGTRLADKPASVPKSLEHLTGSMEESISVYRKETRFSGLNRSHKPSQNKIIVFQRIFIHVAELQQHPPWILKRSWIAWLSLANFVHAWYWCTMVRWNSKQAGENFYHLQKRISKYNKQTVHKFLISVKTEVYVHCVKDSAANAVWESSSSPYYSSVVWTSFHRSISFFVSALSSEQLFYASVSCDRCREDSTKLLLEPASSAQAMKTKKRS